MATSNRGERNRHQEEWNGFTLQSKPTGYCSLCAGQVPAGTLRVGGQLLNVCNNRDIIGKPGWEEHWMKHPIAVQGEETVRTALTTSSGANSPKKGLRVPH